MENKVIPLPITEDAERRVQTQLEQRRARKRAERTKQKVLVWGLAGLLAFSQLSFHAERESAKSEKASLEAQLIIARSDIADLEMDNRMLREALLSGLDTPSATTAPTQEQTGYSRLTQKSVVLAPSIPAAPQTDGWVTLDNVTIVHYCSCTRCCGKSDGITATGTQATQGRTIAVDPAVIPLGAEVEINGQVYIAQDTGVRGRKIDIFRNSHEDAIQLGTYKTSVRVKYTGA